MIATPPKLENSIRAHLAPFLRTEGFSGSGRTFRRITGEMIHVVNVQGSRYGSCFAINLAAHPLGLPDKEGRAADPKKITEELCEFRDRLTDTNGSSDLWWRHDGTIEGMDRAVSEAVEIYKKNAHNFFGFFSEKDPVLKNFDIEALNSRRPDLTQFCFGSEIRVAYIMARLRKIQGRLKEAKIFAAHALSMAKPEFVGYDELQEIVNAA